MTPPINTWDWEELKRAMRERAARFRFDPRVKVRFDESDLTEATFENALKAGRVPDDLDDTRRQLAWLAAIQDRAYIDLYRQATSDKGGDVRRQRDAPAPPSGSSGGRGPEAVDPSDLPPEKAARRKQEQSLADTIGRLPPPQPGIFRLRQRGLTLRRIAEELDLPDSTVVYHYYQGLDGLKKELGDKFKDPGASDENP